MTGMALGDGRTPSKIYRYSAVWLSIQYGLVAAQSGVFALGIVLICYLAERGAIHGNPIIALAILVAALLVWIFVARLVYEVTRPIYLADDAIHALTWSGDRAIPWSEVRRIEKVRFFDMLLSRERYSFIIRGKKRTIRCDDAIGNISDLTRELNNFVRKYDIEVYLRSRSSRSRRDVKAGGASSADAATGMSSSYLSRIDHL